VLYLLNERGGKKRGGGDEGKKKNCVAFMRMKTDGDTLLNNGD